MNGIGLTTQKEVKLADVKVFSSSSMPIEIPRMKSNLF
jgi:hypothetical protein